jgi:nitroimidazol reductase NimA-like FMN-containing flavoprotein (pyridoxamine 5'-phosphate oxidase superfamily)
MSEFRKTERTTVTRLPKRASYDRDTVYQILDEALFCTVSFSLDNQPFQTPTGFCRIDDQVYIHGSVGSHFLRQVAQSSLMVSIGVTLIDGLVLARSAFHHSVNYRSVVLFGKPRLVSDENELYKALEVFTNKMQPGRWDDIRKPSASEWKKTMVIAFQLDEVSAKVRVGPPVDDEDDYALNIWAGVVPLKLERKAPIPDPALEKSIDVPRYLQ